jgi:hydrogenase maturation factor
MFEASKTALSDIEGVARDVGRPLTAVEKADLLKYRLKDAGFDITKLTDEKARDLLRAHESKLREISQKGGGNLSALEEAGQQFVQPYALRRAVSTLTGGGDPLDVLWKEAKARAAYSASSKGNVPQTNMKVITNPKTGETLEVPASLAALFTSAVEKGRDR